MSCKSNIKKNNKPEYIRGSLKHNRIFRPYKMKKNSKNKHSEEEIKLDESYIRYIR